ncbi:MAG: ABC transporter substrate-binding protein [Spirochaetales bacterium]|nr:ABC transporter substrate-binding protein [Spirochaetales bacterium]
MKGKKAKLISAILLLFVTLALSAEQIIVTDLAGRKVFLEVPVHRVVLASGRHVHEFAAVAGKDFLDRIAGWGPDLNLYDQDTYDKYFEIIPEIADVPDVGYHYKGTFSTERVISLNPEVVIFPLWLVENGDVMADIDKLELAGIPSIFIDYNKKPFENPIKSTLLLGTLLGKEERAREITDFYKKQVDIIYSRLKEIDKPRPTVYLEVGSKGPAVYGNTYSNVKGWGAVIDRCRGTNIAEGVIEKSGPIHPEYLLTSNPDIIIFSGSYWPSTSDSMRLGYHAETETSTDILSAFTKRPGWNTLDSVKNHNVHSIFHGFSFRIYNFAGIQAFAKWFYPDEFQDLDPVTNLKEFHNRFMPVEYSGVWMLDLRN